MSMVNLPLPNRNPRRGEYKLPPKWSERQAQANRGMATLELPTQGEEAHNQVLRGMAGNINQPYRPGWAALPGVASSIMGGMAAMKLRQNERVDPERQLNFELRKERLKQLQAGDAGAGAGAGGVKYMKSGNNIIAITPDGQSRVVHEGQPSPLDQLKTRMLKQLVGPQQSQGGVQLQSNEVTTTDPNLVQTQAADPASEGNQSSLLSRLSPEQRQAMGLNLVQPGLGNQLLKANEANDFGDAATNEVEKKIVGAEEQYHQLVELQNQYRPEYQTFEGRLRADFYDLVDKFRVTDNPLNNEQQKYLAEFSQFKRRGLEAINDYIKRITGAQMSEAEADRLRQAMADVGEGIFDGDGPTQFKAKLDDTVRAITMSRARYHFLLKGGWQGSQMSPEQVAKIMQSGNAPISLGDMERIIKQRTGALYRQMKQQSPGVEDGVLRKSAIDAARKEFGI